MSNRAFPEVPVVQRAALGSFLVGVKGRFSRAPLLQKSFTFLFFYFFSSFLFHSLSVFVTFTVLLPPHDTRHPPPPYCTHVLPLSLPTYPSHPCLWRPFLTPSKPCPARLNSLLVSSLRHFSQVSGPPTRPPATVRRATGAPPTP